MIVHFIDVLISHSACFINPNRQLFKALGATSRLLTESITERVSLRTKDAKIKIDKIKNHSKDRFAETTKSATNKLKSVRKNIHDTLEMTQNSLGRVHRGKSGKKRSHTAEYHLERPQTAPINDDMFQSISFSSPLTCKTNNCSNINSAESSYEIPKSIRSLSRPSTMKFEATCSLPPPSYESVVRDSGSASATPTYENQKIPTKTDDARSLASSSSSNEDNDYSVPCPNFPPPVLSEGIYGKLRGQVEEVGEVVEDIHPVQPPTRTKRRKDNEQMKLRVNRVEEVDSNRATVDSTDFNADDQRQIRELSESFSEKLKLHGATLPKPVRSESWSYYDTNSDELSSPEPIYANHNCDGTRMLEEPVYGVIYNPQAPDQSLLAPKVVDRERRSGTKNSNDHYAGVKKSPEKEPCTRSAAAIPKEILNEFDPLDRETPGIPFSNKSNELILLENLLGEETYGTCTEENQLCCSLETSSDDEEVEAPLPTPPERLDSLPESVNENGEEALRKISVDASDENRKTIIVHQNLKLRSDSIDELRFASSVEEETRATKTRWFLPSTSDMSKSKCNEAKEDGPSLTVERRGSKSSMKSMFTNVLNKVEGIKRKTSFRSVSKSDTKTVLEMVPRPCLTQRLTLHEGHLIRLPSRQDILREIHSRKAYIRDRKFQAYCDKDLKQAKESIPLELITTIQCVNEQKLSNNVVDIYSFEITTASPKGSTEALTNPNIIVTSNDSGNAKMQRVCHVYGVSKESERFLWMQKLLDSISEVFPPGFSCRFHRAGWCYSKVWCNM